MDRQIVYPGAIPLDTDLLSLQRNVLVALGALAQATLGTTTIVDGLACTPTAPASMTVNVGAGSITQLTVVDALAFGSLPADSTDPLLKMGVNVLSTPFSFTAPTTSGQSVNFLIEASFQESDATPVVLPYYNASNPSQPYSGPNGAGTAQNTQRLGRVQLQMKSGAPAATGSQQTPAVDNGWSGLYVVTVAYGQTAILASNIAILPNAPFVPFKLPQLTPGQSRMAVITTSTTWSVPAGVSQLQVRLWGAGGGGGLGGTTGVGGGGGGGGYFEGFVPVTPGQQILLTVGQGGAGGTSGTTAGGAGGTTSFGTAASGAGGAGGSGGVGNTNNAGPGGAGGTASGAGLLVTGGSGNSGAIFPNSSYTGAISGFGGGSFSMPATPSTAGNVASSFAGQSGSAPGTGGSGGIGPAGGGSGAAGLIVVEW